MPSEFLPFVRIIIFAVWLAGALAAIRRWRRPTLAIAAVAAAVGPILLGWSGSEGIRAEPGTVHFGSCAGELRIAGVWILGGIIGVVLFTLITGYVK